VRCGSSHRDVGRAQYRGHDGRVSTAPTTYDAKHYAEAWLARAFTDIQSGTWVSPSAPTVAPIMFGAYADTWLADRELKPRTRTNYRSLLDRLILPTFADVPVTSITVPHVRTWHAALSQRVGTTTRAHTYSLLRTIMGSVVSDDLRDSNPCRIHSAGPTKRSKQIRPLSIAELDVPVAEIPERRANPDRVLAAQLRVRRSGSPPQVAHSHPQSQNGGALRMAAPTCSPRKQGLLAGRGSAQPNIQPGHRLLAAGLLVVAGADLDALDRWVGEGRQRAAAPMHSE
jgi:hypothetical protein